VLQRAWAPPPAALCFAAHFFLLLGSQTPCFRVLRRRLRVFFTSFEKLEFDG
jgi:hypothetical protein